MLLSCSKKTNRDAEFKLQTFITSGDLGALSSHSGRQAEVRL